MSIHDDDTETLIAMLCSLLPEPYPSTSLLIDALTRHDGNIEQAATYLKLSTSPRKRVRNLSDWLQGGESESKRTKLESGGSSNSTLPSSSTREVSLDRDGPLLRTEQSLNMPPYPSNNRAVKSAFDVLKDSSDKRPTALPRLQPVTLSTPALVQRHTPCTMHLNILPPELACQLFYAMVQESRSWTTNKWWLFDKLVESPHKTSFWIRDRDPGDFSYEEASKMWYNGRKVETPKAFLSVMEEACDIIEKVVSEQLAPRQRYPLEWGGDCVGGQLWRTNVAASNCYTGRNESVGFHSDQLTYLGPYTTIASLSLGTTRTFRLRETIPKEEAQSRAAQTFNIPLLHNSLTIMHATCQEYFKHSIPPQAALDLFRPPFPPEDGSPWEPSNIRINLTFRFYRPDFHPSTIPRCKCDVPMILRPDMKGRPAQGEEARREIKYWWTCYASAQTEGKGCELWQLFNAKAEGRGPFVDDA